MGSSIPEEIRKDFEKIAEGTVELNSPRTETYNCISFAVGFTDRWWGDPLDSGYWPSDSPYGEEVGDLVRALEREGFSVCENANVELGFEKIAVFAADGYWTHASRMSDDGQWLSKLGKSVDIKHSNNDCISGRLYGEVCIHMKRPIQRNES